MTDNEIIKAMQCVIGNDVSCSECEYQKALPFPSCRRMCAKDALDLINRQKAENERLKCEMGKLLPKDCSYAMQMEVSNKLESQIKSEAMKECLARVKNYIKTHCNPYGKPDFDYDTSIKILNFIDNLVKEMTEENEK